jgi:spore germination protein
LKYNLFWIVALAFTVLAGTFPGAAETVSAAVGSTELNGAPLEAAEYVTVAKVKRATAPVHKKAYSSSARVGTLVKNDEFPVLRSAKYHYQIQLLDGKKGWIRKSYVAVRKAPRYVMGWNYGGGSDRFRQVSASPVLDVVSPRWYKLDPSTIVAASPDKAYVDWAHAQGKQVWAMLGNSFNTQLTDEILTSEAKRAQMVSMLAQSAVANGLDGINVDFENMKIENREEFVTFIRELRTTVAPYGMIVSVDVTRENPDPYWSGCYDRAALGQAADYVVMMAYDEFYQGRGAAGSVASMPWVAEGLRLLLADVPAHKVILGVPFYTRKWIEPEGGGRAVAEELSMGASEKLIAEKGLSKQWDAAAGQHYVEYTDEKGRHRMWMEDAASMKQRWSFVRSQSLGGVAAWAVGMETPEIWNVYQ